MKYKMVRDRQGEGKDKTKMKKYDKGRENMPISFALYGDDSGNDFNASYF